MTYVVKKIAKSLQRTTANRRRDLEQRVEQRALAASEGTPVPPGMKLKLLDHAELMPGKWRVRKSDEAQITRISRGLSFGQRAPIILREDHTIINGHLVAEALKRLGYAQVWCAVQEDLSEDEAAMLHITLNHVAETGEWHLENLGALMLDLDAVGFDMSMTGFSLPEIDLITHGAQLAKDVKDEQAVDEVPQAEEPVSVTGDLWQLGDHLHLCGDATDVQSYERILGADKAHAVFTDCPWNIPIKGFVSKKHQDFKMGAGEWTPEEFEAFVDRFTQLCAENLTEGAAFFSCIDFRSLGLVLAAGKKAGLSLLNLAVWNKGSGGMGSYLRGAHELIPVFCKGAKLASNNVMLGKYGKNRSNVWSYPGANRKGSSAQKAHASHPTPKSVEMVEDALLDVTKPGDIVLDPFLGSGTTLIAAHRTGRKARCIDIDPVYVDVAVRRWEALTGEAAIHVETGLTFGEIAAQRSLDEAA